MDEEKKNEIHKDNNIGKVDSSENNQALNENGDNNCSVESEVCYEKINRKKTILIISCIIIGIIFFLIVLVNSVVLKYEDRVYPGNKLYGKDISKFTKSQVLNEIENIEANIEKSIISIKVKDKQYNINTRDIISSNNKDELVANLINSGKEEGTLEKYFNIVSNNGRDYKLRYEIDNEKISNMIKDISLEVNKKPTEPSISIEGESIEYKEGSSGIRLQEERLVKNIKDAVTNLNQDNNKIEATFENINPTIDIELLKKVDTRISEYSTYYGGGNARGVNIEIAAQKLDDLILMPGEEFSYENTIGPVRANNGYKEASVIINGKIENGIGGGVCQVSSTLYNAQLKAGILPTQRRNHSKAVDYVPRGLDATLASGIIDYRFKNTYEFPLVINTYTSKGRVYTEIWSNSNATKGINYEAVSYISSKKAETYLYGYDKSGNKVYDKYIDTSIYK